MTNPFKQENLYYNKEKDYYVCPMGQHMNRTGVRHYKTESGYIAESAAYRAARCEGPGAGRLQCIDQRVSVLHVVGAEYERFQAIDPRFLAKVFDVWLLALRVLMPVAPLPLVMDMVPSLVILPA